MRIDKFLIVFLAVCLMVFAFSQIFPGPVFAATTLEQAAKDLAQGTPQNLQSTQGIFNILAKIARFTYTAFFIVAVIFIIIAAFVFLTAQGDPEKIKKARTQILWALVAIAIAMLSVGAAEIIRAFVSS